ncbi:MAG TPA: complex I subunit 1 family protein [Candidatus Acidoferrales bacterium]|nr:complex I subunit 1 family protein [Candidatus Acidoferrales bacterium]
MTDWITGHPALLVTILKIVVMLFLLLTAVAYAVWFERKLIAHIQSRWGPYRVGPHGLLQPLADGLKFFFKEDIMLGTVTSRFIYLLAPFLAVTLALLAVAVVPFGPGEFSLFGTRSGLYIADINIGVLFILAVTSLGVYSIALAGWSSNSKYPLIGGLRSSAQMISYELALTFSVIGVLLLGGSLSLRELIAAQAGHWGGVVPRWFLFPQFVAFVCFFVSSVAEANRLPFDLPEAETELVAGFHTEYSSIKFAMFFIAEYAHLFTASFLVTILFLGGWLSPFPETGAWAATHFLPPVVTAGLAVVFFRGVFRLREMWHRALMGVIGLGLLAVAGLLLAQPALLEVVQGPFWFLGKTALLLFCMIWIRGTLPRFRYDQLMAFGWKFLVPVAVLNVVVTSFLVAWQGRG